MRSWSAKAAMIVALGVPAVAMAGRDEAVQSVRRGIEHFDAAKYRSAIEAFTEADAALPDDPRIAFDRGCAYAAQGKTKEARDSFHAAAMARDKGLVAQSHYNLGCLAVAEGRGVFQNSPEEATPEEREQALALMHRAILHFRDCLDLDHSHEDARHNLELVRLWVKHMTALWDERDRQKNRENMDLLQFLEMLLARQESLRVASETLEKSPPSPRRREQLRSASSAQRKLAEEIPALKEKIDKAAEPAPPAVPAVAAPGAAAGPLIARPDAQQTVDRLLDVADEAGRAMHTASGNLFRREPADAEGQQRRAIDRLDEVYREVAPFMNLVQKATAAEQALVDVSSTALEKPEDQREPLDGDLAGWQQDFVTRWAPALGRKAQEALAQAEASPPPAQAPAAGPQNPAPGIPNPAEQLEAMKQSWNKAVENSPKIETLCRDAAGLLRKQMTEQALPKQEEALKLLKEITEELPKRDQQQDSQQDEDKKDQQDKKGEDNKDQQKDQQKQERKRQPKPDPAKERAEAILQRARERQAKHRDEEKRRQRALYVPAEKDW